MSNATPASPQVRRAGVGLRAAAVVALALGNAPAAPSAGAQETTRMTADADTGAPNRDAALVAALGLDLATIEHAENAALLWRAVRELVLPGKVSEATQQRILRRVWVADPAVRQGSYVESPAN